MSKALLVAFLALYVASVVFLFSTYVEPDARESGLVLWMGGLTLGLFIMAVRDHFRNNRV